jgi:hypothetical protein
MSHPFIRTQTATANNNSQTKKHAPSTLALVEITINALQLEIVVTHISTGGIDAVFGRHELKKELLCVWLVVVVMLIRNAKFVQYTE